MIEIKNVDFCYHSHEKATVAYLHSLNLSIATGEFIAIVGRNGSGKSTLAKLLCALLVPKSGTVSVDNLVTADKANIPVIREKIGIVFQNPDNQCVASLVEEDIAFGPENLALSPMQIADRVDAALKAVGMEQYRKNEICCLSGGQKQRSAIAGILALSPKYLVLDEPTAMLDPCGRAQVMAILQRLHAEDGKTIILITHNMAEIIYAQRVIIMQEGTITAELSPKALFSDSLLVQNAGLRLPQIAELAASLRGQGFYIPHSALTIEALAAAL